MGNGGKWHGSRIHGFDHPRKAPRYQELHDVATTDSLDHGGRTRTILTDLRLEAWGARNRGNDKIGYGALGRRSGPGMDGCCAWRFCTTSYGGVTRAGSSRDAISWRRRIRNEARIRIHHQDTASPSGRTQNSSVCVQTVCPPRPSQTRGKAPDGLAKETRSLSFSNVPTTHVE